jgi:hypothetical protein
MEVYITNSSLAPKDFTGIPHYSIMYIDQHKSKKFKSYSVEPKIAIGKTSLLLKGFELKPEDDF